MSHNIRKFWIGVSVALLVSALPALLLAGSFSKHKRSRHEDGGFGPKILAQLDLTEDQRSEIDTLSENHNEMLRQNGEAMRDARRNLQEQISSQSFDELAVRSASHDFAALDEELAVRRARFHAEMLKILTPEQATKARELREELKERAKERRQMRGKKRSDSNEDS